MNLTLLIVYRNGIYTPHREKLFKLQNGFFILYLHKQAVSQGHFTATISPNLFSDLVVHNSIAVHEIRGPSRSPDIPHQEESILQELSHHAPYNDSHVVFHPMARSDLLPPHESHGPADFA